ncbi:MAG: hypothetical protein FWB99_03890 [Treponema sp.]|nr:hypothetical protein [Treponema sp.]MCL2232199.1 hypothetical protein [Treponema sp.]
MHIKTLFIPQNDAAFNQLFRGINQYVAEKTDGAVPEWTHIPDLDRGYLLQVYIDWYSSYVLTLDPHASHIAKETIRIRSIAERALDSFVNRFLRLEPVNDQDRATMGILSGEQIIPSRGAKKSADFEFNLQNIRRIFVDFLNKNAAARKNRAAAFID